MAKRVVIPLAAIGILFLLTAYAQRSQIHPTQQLTVYDADGKRVGAVVGGHIVFGEFLPLISFRVDGVPFMLFVFRDSLTASEIPVWESTDCSGAPFIPFGIPGLPIERSSLPLIAVGLPGTTVYVEDGLPRIITQRSYSTSPSAGPTPPQSLLDLLPTRCQAYAIPSAREAVPARALVDMNTFYTPPFSVR